MYSSGPFVHYSAKELAAFQWLSVRRAIYEIRNMSTGLPKVQHRRTSSLAEYDACPERSQNDLLRDSKTARRLTMLTCVIEIAANERETAKESSITYCSRLHAPPLVAYFREEFTSTGWRSK
jgi:hypothetical protein